MIKKFYKKIAIIVISAMVLPQLLPVLVLAQSSDCFYDNGDFYSDPYCDGGVPPEQPEPPTPSVTGPRIETLSGSSGPESFLEKYTFYQPVAYEWTVPSGVNEILVKTYGAGGGGGTGVKTYHHNVSGFGGGGGGYAEGKFAVKPGTVYTIVVGQGGVSGEGGGN